MRSSKVWLVRKCPPEPIKGGANARRAALELDRPKQVKAYYDLFRQLAGAL